MNGRVLILAPTYPPYKDGVANAAALMAEGLVARGHEIIVGTQVHPERQPSAPGDNPQVHQFDVCGSASWRDAVRGETAQLRRFIGGFRGHAVFCHCLDSATTTVALQEFDNLPVRKVLISHGFAAHRFVWSPKFPWGLPSWLSWQPFVWRLPWLLRRFDQLVFLSQRRDFGRFFDHKVARVLGHPRIRVIPNAVKWQATPEKLPDFRGIHHLNGLTVFLFVANYCDRKNQLLALGAYRRARIPHSSLVFIGSDLNEYARGMQQFDARLKDDYPEGRVLMLQKVDRSLTEAALHTMDIFVLSAKQETQPIVLLEAMAAGKPFISTDTGCVKELAGGVVVRGELEMTRQFQRLAVDADLRARLGSEGRHDYLAKYRPEQALDAYEKLIAELRESR